MNRLVEVGGNRLKIASSDAEIIRSKLLKLRETRKEDLDEVTHWIFRNRDFHNGCLSPVENLLNCRHLRSVDVSETRINEYGLIHLPLQIESLNISSCPVSYEGFLKVGDFRNLRALACRDVFSVRFDGLTFLNPLPKLEVLNLEYCVLYNEDERTSSSSSAGIRHLQNFRSLCKLNLKGTNPRPADIQAISTFESLEDIDLSYNFAIGDSLRKLFDLPIKKLKAASCHLKGKGFEFLRHADHLIDLDLGANRNIGQVEIDSIAQLPSIRVLKFSGVDFSTTNLGGIFEDRMIRTASFVRCKLPKDFGKNVADSLLVGLDVQGSDFGMRELDYMSAAMCLSHLDIRQTPAASCYRSIRHFRKLSPNCKIVASDTDQYHMS